MRQEFSQTVHNHLRRQVGDHCSKCRRPTSGPGTSPGVGLSRGRAAHMCPASPGGPSRPGCVNLQQLESEERVEHDRFLGSEENGIWLCSDCADEVDRDLQAYPVSRLQSIKADAIRRAAEWYQSPREISGVVNVADELAVLRQFREWIYKYVEELRNGSGAAPLHTSQPSLSTESAYGLRISLQSLRTRLPQTMACLSDDGLSRQKAIIEALERMVPVLAGPRVAYLSALSDVLHAYDDLSTTAQPPRL